MIRFKTDENLPKEIAELLSQAGHDAIRVDQQGLSGVADSGIAAVCRVEKRVMITLDTDFLDIRNFPPEHYMGIIVLRPQRQSVSRLTKMTSRLLGLLATETLVGKLWIVDEGRIRIRPESTT